MILKPYIPHHLRRRSTRQEQRITWISFKKGLTKTISIASCVLLSVFIINQGVRYRLLAQFRGGGYAMKKTKNNNRRRPPPRLPSIPLDENGTKCMNHTVAVFNGTCSYLHDYVENEESDRRRYCLVPQRDGSSCRLRTIDANEMNELGEDVVRLVGDGWLRTANQLMSIKNLLMMGSSCRKVVLIENKNRLVDGLPNNPMKFSCIDFTDSYPYPYQRQQRDTNYKYTRMESKPNHNNDEHCFSGDQSYEDMFWIKDKHIQYYEERDQYAANRLLMAFMGVTKNSYRGQQCNTTIPRNTAVAHLRSGDIMKRNNNTNSSIVSSNNNDNETAATTTTTTNIDNEKSSADSEAVVKVDPWYGQPPLEFYQKAIQQIINNNNGIKEEDRIRTLLVISEDNSNPVFDALKGFNEEEQEQNNLTSINTTTNSNDDNRNDNTTSIREEVADQNNNNINRNDDSKDDNVDKIDTNNDNNGNNGTTTSINNEEKDEEAKTMATMIAKNNSNDKTKQQQLLTNNKNTIRIEKTTDLTYEEVIQTLLCANTLIASRSTMNAFLQASPNLNNYYRMDFGQMGGQPFHHTTEYVYSSPQYGVVENEWTNSDQQRTEMLQYNGGALMHHLQNNNNQEEEKPYVSNTFDSLPH